MDNSADGNSVTTHTSAKNSPLSADGSNTRIGGLSHPDYTTGDNKVIGVAGNGIMESLTTKPFIFDQRPGNVAQTAADMDHLGVRMSEFVSFITNFEHPLDMETPVGAVVAYVKAHLGNGLPQWAKDQIADGKHPPSIYDGIEDGPEGDEPEPESKPGEDPKPADAN